MVHEQHMENLLEEIERFIESGRVGDALAVLQSRHAADQADLIEHLDEDVQQVIVEALSPDELAEVIEYLDDELRSRLLARLPGHVLVSTLDEVDENVAADILQELPEEQREALVSLLEERESVAELLSYPEDSAGGVMSADFVALRRDWSVQESIEFLRREAPDAEQPFYLYVVDDEMRLTGTVNLRALITSSPDTPIAAIMIEEIISVHTTDDQEVVAERVRHYNLLALPVIDAGGRLRGVITADDVLDVQVEEATEDMFRLAGLPEEERLFRPLRDAVPARLGWLMLNLLTALLAALTVNLFEGTISRVATLAVFMPIVAGMGGNAGIQTITLVVRSIALGEVGQRDAARVIKHEAAIALIKGVVIGLIVCIVAWAWKGNAWLGVIVGIALLANIANATIVGVMVPLTLKRLKADPALASGVIVTTFSDVTGFLVFLGLATIFVTHLS